MEITSADILKKLPNFEDLLTITDDISKALMNKLVTEKEIKVMEASIINTAMTDSKYYVGGKAPSMAFLESTYIYTGFNGELLPLRDKYFSAVAEFERLKSRLDLYKEFLNMWRTLNATERTTNG
jgi:hypothetical protein